ncbi:MAG: hypothetical protein HY510_02320 [Acidobacteria bacterium]|nr:hypothetical protein [Acidobacteriota bacterium]
MPHVVLEGREARDGRLVIDEFAARFEPFVVREQDLLVKAERLYRERDGRAALVEVVVVERGFTQKFFIQLSPKDAGVTVRLEPLTDPEKTAGVRRAIALLAHRIVEVSGCVYGRTNIQEYLVR